MIEKTTWVLEFDKIKDKLCSMTGSEMASERLSELEPFDEVEMAREALAETDEAAQLIMQKGILPLGNFYDITEQVVLASKGGTLTMKQLLDIRYDLESCRRVKTFLKGDVPELPIHFALAELLEAESALSEDIDSAIDSESEMNDNASAQLRSIRGQIVSQNDAIKAKLNKIINFSDNEKVLQDAIVTIRDGRYVVPVKAEHRSSVPGIVHDQSASGATLFVEPQAIVDANNKLRELEIAEQAEIERILADFSMRVAAKKDVLLNDLELLIKLDMITAKGKLARDMDGERPEITEGGELLLRQARHPLIDRERVVPVDISVGGDYKALIVTGPNTGGKTVTLKTAGLLSLMAGSGLFIPAFEGSKVPLFKDIYADIGDEQSIEQSLSTFSSHMKNIVMITKEADADSLVLLDELGAGTDPTEGAALAISVLDHLIAIGADVIATTHYTELKKYAIRNKNACNASMVFDVETLSPTYKMNIGVPGKSNAFEISQKLGLDERVIDQAKEMIEGKDLEFEDVLSEIEEDRRRAEDERDAAIMMNIEVKERAEKLQNDREKFEKQRENLLSRAREEARDIVDEAKELLAETRKELKTLSDIEDSSERNKRFENLRRQVKDAAGRYKEKFIKEENDAPVDISTVELGDRVRVLSLSQNGEVISLPDDDGIMQVRVGMMKLRVGAEDLKLINDGTKKKKKPSASVSYGSMAKSKSQSVSGETDVRGQNLDEALMNTAKYIDDAFIAGLEKVRIIHGRGEGILSKGIRNDLQKNKNVASFERGAYNEGGDGVTIVTLKR